MFNGKNNVLSVVVTQIQCIKDQHRTNYQAFKAEEKHFQFCLQYTDIKLLFWVSLLCQVNKLYLYCKNKKKVETNVLIQFIKFCFAKVQDSFVYYFKKNMYIEIKLIKKKLFKQ